MNNVTFGGAGWTFYETLGGGQGASAKGPGPDAVHVGMSNTRNTPIESLERAYPIEIARYADPAEQRRCRAASRWRREWSVRIGCWPRARSHCSPNVAPARREVRTVGVTVHCGENLLNGEPLPAKCRRELKPGDVLEIRTPGGGGWGASARP